MQLIFFAHGTTLDNELGNATGWLPGKLSGVGVKQAKELGPIIKEFGVDVLFTSDLARAINTGLLAVGHDIDTRADWRLREANYGKHCGTPKSFKADMTAFIDTPYPEGESYKDAERRMASFIHDMQAQFEGKTIGVIGHEATQLAIDVIIKGISWEEAIAQNWRTTGSWQPGWKYDL